MECNLKSLVPLPRLTTHCGRGCGVAVCLVMGVLVTASDHELLVYALPNLATLQATAGLTLLHRFGARFSTRPRHDNFRHHFGCLGRMVFTDLNMSTRLLLVTDVGRDAVHVVDVANEVHNGYVAAPGTISGPQGVATRGSLVAVSAWDENGGSVHLFECTVGAGWTPTRVLARGQLRQPFGLRFTADGAGLVVAEGRSKGCIARVSVVVGSVTRCKVNEDGDACSDVEKCKGGWLVACSDGDDVKYVGVDGQATLGHCGEPLFRPVALALVPGLGLVVRENTSGRLQFFATPDAVAMASMSARRVGWLAAVFRGSLFFYARHSMGSMKRTRTRAPV